MKSKLASSFEAKLDFSYMPLLISVYVDSSKRNVYLSILNYKIVPLQPRTSIKSNL